MHQLKWVALLLVIFISNAYGQTELRGKVLDKTKGIPFAKVKIPDHQRFALTDENGHFSIPNTPPPPYTVHFHAFGYADTSILVTSSTEELSILLRSLLQNVEEMVVSGTLKETSKKESTVNIEVYNTSFFQKNPTACVYDALQNVNGVRPQLNCNICNTGDIHINGLEGPYTMVLVDGMPIVSSLSTVYGLSGIPSALIQRIEIVKGPASTLYGSEAIGGIINIITKSPQNAPLVSIDAFTTSWLETNADLSFKLKVNEKIDVLTGINYFNYDLKKDVNKDGFTDVTLQDRISAFQKWNIKRKNYRQLSFAGRYFYEDRWGGEMDWTPVFRGGDSIYGESIYTTRWELMGNYQLPFNEKIILSTSVNQHRQNSYYGTTSFMADQFIGFAQLFWDKKWKKHDLLIGAAVRYTFYDDDTPATESSDSLQPRNQPQTIWLPGMFFQDEFKVSKKHKLLGGMRYDFHSIHGAIFTPRLGYKWDLNGLNSLRINTGTGYRVVNIFTEDHAALTGARDVIIEKDIAPEKSYNANVNFNSSIYTKTQKSIEIDFTAFYTYFTNRIIANYEKDPNAIYYENLTNHAVSQGLSLNLTFNIVQNLHLQLGGTFLDIASYEDGKKIEQMLTEKFSGTWSATYKIPKLSLSIDYTGNVYSPMRLPVLHELDPRPDYSPWWSIQNIQFTYKGFTHWDIYAGAKNLLNWTPAKSADFLIARSHDPFDKKVDFDSAGNALSTSENPYALTFDPSYVYAPNQGIRAFVGIRYRLQNIKRK